MRKFDEIKLENLHRNAVHCLKCLCTTASLLFGRDAASSQKKDSKNVQKLSILYTITASKPSCCFFL